MKIYISGRNEASDPALELQELEILFWSHKCSPGTSDPALEPQIQPWGLRSSRGTWNLGLKTRMYAWILRFNPGALKRITLHPKWRICEMNDFWKYTFPRLCPNIEMWFWRWQAWEWKVRERNSAWKRSLPSSWPNPWNLAFKAPGLELEMKGLQIIYSWKSSFPNG